MSYREQFGRKHVRTAWLCLLRFTENRQLLHRERRLGVCRNVSLLVTQRITKYPVLVERIIQNTEGMPALLPCLSMLGGGGGSRSPHPLS